MSKVTAPSTNSSSLKPWPAWKKFGADKHRSNSTTTTDGQKDQALINRNRLGVPSLADFNKESVAKPNAGIFSVRAIRWKVGVYRRENNRNQKRQKDTEVISRRQNSAEREEETVGRHLQEEARQKQWREDAALIENYTVYDETTLVTCAAGLEVWHAVTGFDLCKLTIKNLPNDYKESEIADILAGWHVPFPDFLITRHRHTPKEATILVDKEVGHALAVKLNGLVFRDQVLGVDVSSHTKRYGMVSTEQLSPFLNVSWKGQTDTLIASYPSNEEATKRVTELNGMLWKTQKLAVVLNQHQRTSSSSSSSSTKSVKITRYPPDAVSDPDFLGLIGTKSYRILKTKPYNHQCTLIMVRIHLRQQRGVRMDTYEELTSPTDVDETTVKVHFDHWEDVKRAHDVFDRKKLGTGEETTPTLRVSSPRPVQCYTRISRRQYQAQAKQWNALKERKQGTEANLYITEHGENIVIYVSGYDLRTAGALKVRVEKLAAGQGLDSSHWHPEFAHNSKQFFKRVHGETGVHIKVESRMQFLKVFGEPEKVAHACSMIKAEVQRLRCMETAGNDEERNVDGDPVCEEGGHDHLVEYLFPKDQLERWAPSEMTCVVCYCEASAPEHLRCGHVYCTECLQHHLASAFDTRKFPISCIGNDATCNTPLPIPVIRRHTDKQAFQHLVEAAFACHLEQHPEEYRYCTTPDCMQIYRFRRKEAWKCPSCLLRICPGCEEEFHEGVTCEERRLQRDPAFLEQLKESLGYRRCPKCNAWIEKAGGCNHITCKCGSHICWRCMGHFTVGEIYKHLNKARCKTYEPPPIQNVREELRVDRCLDRRRQNIDGMRCGTRERESERRCVVM